MVCIDLRFCQDSDGVTVPFNADRGLCESVVTEQKQDEQRKIDGPEIPAHEGDIACAAGLMLSDHQCKHFVLCPLLNDVIT